MTRDSKQPPLTPKVLLFGGGNFMRAFVGWMIQRMNQTSDFNGGIILIKPTARGDYQQLVDQDGQYHLLTQGLEKGEKIDRIELVDNIVQIIHPYNAWKQFLDSAHVSSIRFVTSNTTESGLLFNPDDRLDQTPNTFPGKVTAWLWTRFRHFNGSPGKGCYFLPCELVDKNGERLKTCIKNYINHWELPEAFSIWVDTHNYFCNTLVDRIVTGFPTAQSEHIFRQLGMRDKKLVAAEPYHLWAIEPAHNLPVEFPLNQADLNVIFSMDIQVQRTLKVRILNGLHTAMVPVGYLSGEQTVRKVLSNAILKRYLNQLLTNEIVPSIDLPRDQVQSYAASVFDRFENPFIDHYLMDISLNSLAKFKVRLLPSLKGNFGASQNLPDHLIFALASLVLFYRGHFEDKVIARRDSNDVLAFFNDIWKAHGAGHLTLHELGLTVLANQKLWGEDLNRLPGLTRGLSEKLKTISEVGIERALQKFNHQV